MRDKQWIKIRIIGWSTVAILLTIVLVMCIGGWGSNRIMKHDIFNKGFYYSNMKVVREVTFDNIDDIKNIKADLNTSDLIVNENKEDNIKLIIRCNKTLKNKKYIDTQVDSHTLNITDFNNKSSENIFKILNGCSLEVEIKLPKNYKCSMDINKSAGDIEFISDLKFNNLNIDLKTGDIECDQKINADKITINNRVGDIELDYVRGNDISIQSKKGDIYVDNLGGKGVIDSQNGDVTCNIEKLNGNFNIKSKIGDVDLSVSRRMSFIIKGNKGFDEIDSDIQFNHISQSTDNFLAQYGNNPIDQIIVNVENGDIIIDN